MTTINLFSKHKAIIKEELIIPKNFFESCHASTITQSSNGSLLISYFAGREEGDDSVAIYLSDFDNFKWNKPRLVVREKKACWNPVLFTNKKNEIMLFYKAGSNPQLWSGYLIRSFDNGKTFSKKEELPAGIIGPVKNRPIELEDNTLICPSSIESYMRWGCYMDITKDYGKTWIKSSPINFKENLFGIIQPTIFYNNNTLIMLARSYQIGYICSSKSFDNGMSWSEVKKTNLLNPNSAIDAIKLKDNRIALIYNNSKDERYPLNLAISNDGEKFEDVLILEEEEGEFSYPCIIQTKGEKLHITYTYNRVNIKHVVIDSKLL
jgi:predicted neuraminidase